jgi:hypothetical protein
LVRWRFPRAQGFLALVNLLLGESIGVSIDVDTPTQPVKESSAVACIGQLLDTPGELLTQFVVARVGYPAFGSVEVVAQRANVKCESKKYAMHGSYRGGDTALASEFDRPYTRKSGEIG